ncbi:APC family permease [Paenarthrobacter sp. PH39-S1]|uniref:APC family permease n=1 Tax=Paenarthrobacter sp. PH39-S1 TaxID=3046204 RepID=UPI0024B8E09E|nr:APC family permease [Paenarthrobacter sp. PH39-S1]MDJ0358564.1 APC family permease [Paenarthrobacter sp. PH39-S1]
MTCVPHKQGAPARRRESRFPVPAHGKSFITARSPVEGLSRRKLSFLPVFAQAVAATAPAGSMSVIPALIFPALVFGSTGPNLVLIFGTAMAVMVLVSFCLRPMAKRMAAVSGLYSYTAKGLGQGTAITVGWSAMFGYALVAMAGLLVVGTYVVQLFINLGVPLADPKVFAVLVVLAAAGAACFLMVRGVRISAWSTLLIESISIGILAVLMIGYFAFTAPKVNIGNVFVWNGNFDSLSIGIVVAVSAFVGFESPTTLGGEAYKPFVSIPRAITWTPILTGVLYLLAVTAQDVALKESPINITASSTPLSDLFAQNSPVFAAVLDLGIAASWFACSIASVNALARILFCMGREGVAPRILGRTHPVFRTPSMAILVIMPVVAIVPIAVILSGASPEQSLVHLFTLGAYGYLGSYILASASLPFFLRRIGENTYASWILGAATSLVLGLVLWKAATVSIQTGNLQIFIYGGVLLASVVYTMFLRLRLPERLASVGIYDETRESDLFHGGPVP